MGHYQSLIPPYDADDHEDDTDEEHEQIVAESIERQIREFAVFASRDVLEKVARGETRNAPNAALREQIAREEIARRDRVAETESQIRAALDTLPKDENGTPILVKED